MLGSAKNTGHKKMGRYLEAAAKNGRDSGGMRGSARPKRETLWVRLSSIRRRGQATVPYRILIRH